MVSHNFPFKDSQAVTNRHTRHDLNKETEEHCWCIPQILVWRKRADGRMGWEVVAEGGGQSAFDGSLEPQEEDNS